MAVEPATSAVLSGKEPGPHKIQGIGAGFIPKVMDLSLVDEIIPVDNDVAFDTTREVAKTDGLLIGISSGAVLHAAEELAGRPENKDKNIERKCWVTCKRAENSRERKLHIVTTSLHFYLQS